MAVTDAEGGGDGDEIRVGIPFIDLHFSILLISYSISKRFYWMPPFSLKKQFCENMMFAILLFHTFGFALCFFM